MLEILGLVAFCGWIGRTLKNKGQKPLPYQVLSVIAYYGGVFCSAFLYGIVSAGDQPLSEGNVFFVALFGGLMGLAGVALLAALLPQVNQRQTDEEVPVLSEHVSQ